MEPIDFAQLMHSIYKPSYAFPEWSLQQTNWNTFDFNKTVVYYNEEDDIDDVKLLVKEREPCNMALNRLYKRDNLEAYFGWKIGAYHYSTKNKLMPNIAVYCKATVHIPYTSIYKSIHVINLIGYAFDSADQPDYHYFADKPLHLLIDKYRLMWKKAIVCACFLKKNGEIHQIKIYNVGGGAFAGHYTDIFITEIFEPAFLPFIPLLTKNGIEVLGYDIEKHEFNGGFIPDSLAEEDTEHILYVNAWDPWSLIGNGNAHDNSLDGYWGRSSNMAVLGWSMTNPFINYKEV
jgi:hypothetical protein